MIGRFASIDMRRLTLFGHSLAGYFALWSLFEAESPFDRVCAASPSIWWDQDHLLAGLPHLAGRESHVDILMGEWEGDLPPWQAREPDADRVRARRAERDMIGTARALSERMAAHLPPGHCSFRLLPEEDHASLVSAAMPRALRLASRP